MATRKTKTKTTDLTIVVGTYNRPQAILNLLRQLQNYRTKINFEVIVFDQSSKANHDLLKKQFPKSTSFKLIKLGKPNTCQYLNLGWQSAKADIVLYLDDDVKLTSKALTAHLEAYQDATVKGVAGRVINQKEKTTTRNQVGKILWYGAQFIKNFAFAKAVRVDFPYGCNMSFRKDALKEICGFDENLSPPIYAFNEVDLGYRINKKWENSILFSPEALVYHHQYKKGGTRNDFTVEDIFRSNQFNYGYFLGKNFSLLENIICFMRRLPYQLIKEPRAILNIMKGFIYGKRMNA